MMLPRVLLADDHGIFAEGLQRLLAGHAEVVGRLDRADDLEAEAARVHPDVILLDLSMPGIGGLEALDLEEGTERHPLRRVQCGRCHGFLCALSRRERKPAEGVHCHSE